MSMQSERDRAAWALDDLAASLTQEARRKASTIEEQDDLAARFQSLLDGAVQREAEQAVSRGAGTDTSQVDEFDPRQHGAGASALRQGEAIDPLLAHGEFARKGRRSRPEDRHCTGAVGAQQRHVASVVSHALFLLERPIVLLVNADQAEPLDGGEERGAGSDGDLHLTRAEGLPHCVATGVAEPL